MDICILVKLSPAGSCKSAAGGGNIFFNFFSAFLVFISEFAKALSYRKGPLGVHKILKYHISNISQTGSSSTNEIRSCDF